MVILAALATATAAPVDDLRIDRIGRAKRTARAYEGDKRHLSREAAQNLTLEVCPVHFPPGSETYSRIERAAALYSEARHVGIDITVVPAPAHRDPADLFRAPAADDPPWMRLDYTAIAPNGKPLPATGSVSFWNDALRSWRWKGAQPPKTSDHTVLLLNPDRGYAKHHAHPDPADPEYDGRRAPSLGVVSHELGHALGFGHDMDRTEPGLKGMSVIRGAGKHVTHGVDAAGGATRYADGRLGRITAYGQWLLEAYYGTGDARDEGPEWSVHELIVLPRPTVPPGSRLEANTTWEAADLNPTALRLKGERYVDCRTGEDPVVTVQYSDISNQLAPEAQATVAWELEGLGTVASRTHPAQDPRSHYVQYTWTRTLEIRVPAGRNPRKVHEAVPLTARVSQDGEGTELAPHDNALQLQVRLLPERTPDSRCR